MTGERQAVPMTIGRLSRLTGAPIKTLREYTDLGLIHTLGRSPANYRQFDADALWCVRWISELRSLGLTVAEIRELTAVYKERTGRPFGPTLAERLQAAGNGHGPASPPPSKPSAGSPSSRRLTGPNSGTRTAPAGRTTRGATSMLDPHPGGRPYGPRTEPNPAPWRATIVDTQQFAARFVNSLTSAPGLQLWLVRPLQKLLATGEPVTIAALAAQACRGEEEIRKMLAVMPDTEYDAAGRIIGYGLTFNPTPHRYETGGRTLYTWCALDTLVFPALLDHTAQVTSPCRATKEPVRLTVAPDHVTDIKPATTVVSVVAPDTPTSVRTSFCDQSHFFTNAEAAKDWLIEHPDAQVLPAADALDIGRPVVEQILSGGTQPTSTDTQSG